MYRIKNWNDFYENSRSRKVKDLAWVPIPNRHDGESYARLMMHKDAPVIFTVWVLLLQVASRCQNRGILMTSSGIAHTPETLSIKTRAKVDWFEKSLPFLVQIGWLEHECHDGTMTIPGNWYDSAEERKKEGNGIHNTISDKPKRSKLPDHEFMEELKKLYPSINMEDQINKMKAWLLTPKARGRSLTRQFMVNWLNRCDSPVKTNEAQKFVL